MTQQYSSPPEMTIDPSAKYTATIHTDKGDMSLELLPADAPITVNNFVFLAREGFYTGGGFHRVIKDFMIQGGCPKGDGTGGPGYRFQDEKVTRRYSKGTLAMANAGPNTNGSQFFIVHGDDVGLPPNYTIFGMLAEGLDVLDALATSPVGGRENSSPTEPSGNHFHRGRRRLDGPPGRQGWPRGLIRGQLRQFGKANGASWLPGSTGRPGSSRPPAAGRRRYRCPVRLAYTRPGAMKSAAVCSSARWKGPVSCRRTFCRSNRPLSKRSEGCDHPFRRQTSRRKCSRSQCCWPGSTLLPPPPELS